MRREVVRRLHLLLPHYAVVRGLEDDERLSDELLTLTLPPEGGCQQGQGALLALQLLPHLPPLVLLQERGQGEELHCEAGPKTGLEAGQQGAVGGDHLGRLHGLQGDGQ